MIATAAGPYEHTGAYQESELFDTSGVPVHRFCPDCEHAPCVAGLVGFCRYAPRFIVTQRLERDLLDQVVKHRGTGPVATALVIAISRMSSIASGPAGSLDPDCAFRGLDRMLVALRREDES